MGKKVTIQEHMSLAELESLASGIKDRDEYRRCQVVLLVARGETILKASQICGFDYDHSKKIVRRYNSEGPESLKDGRRTRGSRPPRNDLLTPAQKEELFAILSGPCPDGGLWTGPKAAKEIERLTGRKDVRRQRGWDYLKRLGFRLRRPRRRHIRSSDEDKESF
jgi:transposase